MIDRLLEQTERIAPNPIVRRIILHTLFWIVWLSRNFYDTYQPFELKGACVYIAIIFISQTPLVYFHLYFLVPKFLRSKNYFVYIPVTIGSLLLYSNFNFWLMHHIPEAMQTEPMQRYIAKITPSYDVLEGFIVIMLSYALKYTVIAYITQNELLKLQKEKLQLELNALKAQINPHFFFNTLNNLYSLTLKNSSQSSEVVLKLSDLMRYVLYECNEEKVLLSKEVSFVQNYLELERLRYNANYKIEINISGDAGNKKIAPMLLIEFVENAFKHGLGRMYNSGWLHIGIEMKEKELC